MHNLGGIGFNFIDGTSSNIYLSGNTLRNNRAMVIGSVPRGRVGAIGFSVSNASISLVNNTIDNNNAICIGGVGFDLFGGTAVVSGNLIYSNTNIKSEWGAGGLAFDEASGDITISYNTVYNNTNLATGSGGIGLNSLLEGASVLLEGNWVYSNTGHKVGGIGVINPATTDITLSQNTVFNNAESGIGIWSGSFINIQENVVFSNGLSSLLVEGELYASGIQLRDSTFINTNISGNTIHNNYFAGIQAYNTDGYFGPDNYIHDNGNGQPVDCIDGTGSGDGGVAVRGLAVSDTLIVSNNLLVNNNVSSVSRKDCIGTVRLNGQDVECGFWTKEEDIKVYVDADGKVYLDGSWHSDTPIIDCSTNPSIPFISGGTMAWGVVVAAGATGVTIRNCDIYNNNTSCNDFGPGTDNLGGGIFLGKDVEAKIHDNNIYNNGCEEPVYSGGGSAGIIMRCVSDSTGIYSNRIYGNLSDGIDIRDSGAVIGKSGSRNSIYNNARHGLGVGGTSNPLIAFNTIYNNGDNGIGIQDSSTPTIVNNYINNHTSWPRSGIGIIDLASPSISNNLIYDNVNGIGFGQGADEYDNNVGDSGPLAADEVQLDGGADGTDGYYNGMLLVLEQASVGSPRETVISDYLGGSNVATIIQDWNVKPATNDAYTIYNIGYSGTVVVGSNNSIYNNSYHAIGIQGTNAADITIDGNELTATGAPDGISMKVNTNTRVTFSNNPLISGFKSGIQFMNNDGMTVVIDGNDYITDCSDAAIEMKYNSGTVFSLTNNIIASNDIGYRMQWNNGGSVYIANNSIRNIFVEAGVEMQHSPEFPATQPSLENVIITSNFVANCSALRGIRIQNIDVVGDISIRNNDIFNNKRHGAAVQDSSMDTLVFDNNLITNTLWGSNDDSGFGMQSNTLSNIIITNNTTRNQDVAGMELKNNIGLDNLVIADNYLFSNGRRGIRLDNNDCNILQITDNIILSSGGYQVNQDAGVEFKNSTIGTVYLTGNTLRNNTEMALRMQQDTISVLSMVNNIMDGHSKGAFLMDKTGHGFNVTDLYVVGNTITNNGGADSNKPGAIGLDNFTNTTAATFINNVITSNTASKSGVGGMGVDNYTGDQLSIVNNIFRNNTADAWSGNHRPGALGFRSGNGTVYIADNQFYSNTGVNEGAGGLGFEQGVGTAAVFLIEDNTFRNNTGGNLGPGGIGFDEPDFAFTIQSNTINNNTGDKAGGLGIYCVGNDCVPNASIMNNVVYSNTSTGSQPGGIGLMNLYNSVVLMKDNDIYSNDGWSVGGIGMKGSRDSDVTIVNNSISNNLQSGIGAWKETWATSRLTIQDNFILSNGLNNTQIGDEIYAAGIELRNFSFVSGQLAGNTIRNNWFAGIEAYNTDGYIGPDNSIVYNGHALPLICQLEGPGSGDGGVAVRDLDVSKTLLISSNEVENNVISSVSRRDCNGTVKLNGVDVDCGYWTRADAAVFIHSSTTLNCNGGTISGGAVWGVAVIGETAEVTITNCTIENNMTADNDYGPGTSSMGGGIFVGPNTFTRIYSNVIRYNGVEVPTIGYGANAGVVVRCGGTDKVTLTNNLIASNASDGVNFYDSGGFIGLDSFAKANTIRNNGRHGVGLTGTEDGIYGGPPIAYNVIHNNGAFGIGGYNVINMNANINNNLIYSNHPSAAANNYGVAGADIGGGIGMIAFSSEALIENNTIRNNYGPTSGAGIGFTNANNAIITVRNNLILDNNSSNDSVGGLSFTDGSGISAYLEGNILASNQGKIGGMGLQSFSGNIRIENNTVRNNTADHNGGIALGNLDTTGSITVVGNSVYNNTSSEVGGVGVDLGNGVITIANNTIFNNESTGSKTGGLGFIQPGALASILVEGNQIYGNTGYIVGGLGVTASNSSDITIRYNTITNNDQSGIGIFDSDNLTIHDNLIFSNGLQEEIVAGILRNGFGIQLRDSSFAFNSIYSNTIRHNKFAGIGAYNVGGTIGPNNVVVNNGNMDSISCGSIADGYGGVATRNLSSGDLHVMDYDGAVFDEATNLVIDNYNIDQLIRPQGTGGDFIYNGKTIGNQWFGPTDAVYFFNGVQSGTTGNIDCSTQAYKDAHGGTSDIDATDKAFGVLIIGAMADVAVTNCTVKNAAYNYAALEKIQAPGDDERIAGAGILVAANASASLANNFVTNNGLNLARARIIDPSQSSLGGLLQFFWVGGNQKDDYGYNEMWAKIPDLPVDGGGGVQQNNLFICRSSRSFGLHK